MNLFVPCILSFLLWSVGLAAEGGASNHFIMDNRNPIAASQKKDDAMQETIWSLETAYSTHLFRAEYEKVLALVHPDFLGWPDGVSAPIDREGSAAFMRKLIPKPVPCRIQIERAGIEIQGNVALTQYILHVHCRGTDGTITTRSSRMCHTWIKEGANWKVLGGMSRDLSSPVTK